MRRGSFVLRMLRDTYGEPRTPQDFTPQEAAREAGVSEDHHQCSGAGGLEELDGVARRVL